jgi:hypothetical protein
LILFLYFFYLFYFIISKHKVSAEYALSHEKQLTEQLLKREKLLLVLDLDKTLVHATTDTEKLTPNPLDKGVIFRFIYLFIIFYLFLYLFICLIYLFCFVLFIYLFMYFVLSFFVYFISFIFL